MSIEDQINSLSRNEMIVLYWKCKGLTHEQIRLRLDYSLGWVQLQMSNVYAKLGFEKSMHWTKRVGILDKEVCPRLPKNIDDWEPVEVITEGTTEESKEDITPDAEMMALVIYDEMELEKQKNKAITPQKGKVIVVGGQEENPWTKILIFAVVSLLIVSVIAYFAYTFGRGATPAPEIIVITATPIPATETPVDTLTPIFTQTFLPTFTFTPEPSFTPLPTATPKGYVDQGENIELRDGVYAYISENFQGGGNPCWKPNGGFAVIIYIENTSDDYFDIRFDATAFHAVDNFGNEYQLLGSGIFFCTEKVGIIEGSVRGGDRTNLGAQFTGIIPLDAEYVDITIDFISGFGPITFRKYIY